MFIYSHLHHTIKTYLHHLHITYNTICPPSIMLILKRHDNLNLIITSLSFSDSHISNNPELCWILHREGTPLWDEKRCLYFLWSVCSPGEQIGWLGIKFWCVQMFIAFLIIASNFSTGTRSHSSSWICGSMASCWSWFPAWCSLCSLPASFEPWPRYLQENPLIFRFNKFNSGHKAHSIVKIYFRSAKIFCTI